MYHISSKGAIDAVLAEAAIKLGKKLFPVRDPALGPGEGFAEGETIEQGYVNTSWEVMVRGWLLLFFLFLLSCLIFLPFFQMLLSRLLIPLL